MNELNLGIGLNPNREAGDVLIGMSKKLSGEYNISYTLDGINYHPHLTLFQGKFRSCDDLGFIESIASEYNNNVRVILGELGIFSDSFVFYDCEKTNNLIRLHKDVVAQANEKRIKEADTIASEQDLAGLTEAEITSLENYGYQFVGKAFRPHFTIGRVLDTNPSEEELREVLNHDINHLNGYRFSPNEMIIYETGIDGSCVKTIRKFSLSK